jgi:hypothetical protein
MGHRLLLRLCNGPGGTSELRRVRWLTWKLSAHNDSWMIGQKFTRLTVVSDAARLHRKRRWVCSCSCGGSTVAFQWSLLAGRSRSCGCLWAEELNQRQGNENHGMHRTPEYKAWLLMNRRCYDPTYRGYGAYGGSDVTVCEGWRTSFSAFFEDMGRRPSPEHKLVLTAGETFAPGKCRWAQTRRREAS